jgi:hypothetical protein
MTRRMLHEGLHCDGLNQDSLSCDGGGLLPGEGRHHHEGHHADGLHHHDDDDDRRYDGLHQEGGREGHQEGLLRTEGHNNNGLRQNEVYKLQQKKIRFMYIYS